MRARRHFGLDYAYHSGELVPTTPLELAPRSAYMLSGKARWSWQHSIAPTKALRYSITFRTLRRA